MESQDDRPCITFQAADTVANSELKSTSRRTASTSTTEPSKWHA